MEIPLEEQELKEQFFKCNFFRLIDEFLYFNAQAVKFFRFNIISDEILNNYLKLILYVIENNFHNIVLLFNVSSRNFVTAFKALGSPFYNFLIILADMVFTRDMFTILNFSFLTETIIYTLKISDPNNKRQVKELPDLSSEERIRMCDTKKHFEMILEAFTKKDKYFLQEVCDSADEENPIFMEIKQLF